METRWNSNLMMLRSIFALRSALESIRDNEIPKLDCISLVAIIPTEEQFNLVQSIIPVLTKIEALTEFMSGDNYPTICHVISKLSFLHNFLESTKSKNRGTPVAELVEHISTYLESKLPKQGCEEKIYAYAHLLHPCFRGKMLNDHGLFTSTIDMFVEDNDESPGRNPLCSLIFYISH